MEKEESILANTKQVLLLKTFPHSYRDVKSMAIVLNNYPCIIAWDIDFDDSDRVLRIESVGLEVEEIIRSLYQVGVWSEEL